MTSSEKTRADSEDRESDNADRERMQCASGLDAAPCLPSKTEKLCCTTGIEARSSLGNNQGGTETFRLGAPARRQVDTQAAPLATGPPVRQESPSAESCTGDPEGHDLPQPGKGSDRKLRVIKFFGLGTPAQRRGFSLRQAHRRRRRQWLRRCCRRRTSLRLKAAGWHFKTVGWLFNATGSNVPAETRGQKATGWHFERPSRNSGAD